MPHYRYSIANKIRKEEDNILNTENPTEKTKDKKTLKTASKETAEKNYAMEDPQTNSKIVLGGQDVPSSSSRYAAACSLSSQSIEPRPKSRHDANPSEQPQEKGSFFVQHWEEIDQSSTEHSVSRSSAAPSGFRCISKNDSIVSMEKPLTVAKGVLSEAHLVFPPLPGKPTEASAVEAELPLSVSEETQPTGEASQPHGK